MASKKVKVRAWCNMFENGTNYKKGDEFVTTEKRMKALGDSVELVTKKNDKESQENENPITDRVEENPPEDRAEKGPKQTR